MDRDDRLCFRCDLFFCVDGVDVEAPFEAIAEHWSCPEIGDHLGGGGKSIGGYQHFVAALEPNGIESELQRGSARIHR